MSSLYKIQEDIYNIFSEVEDNDGEITEEQLKLLDIKQEELKEKLDSYYKAIQIWKHDFEACKAEKKRINDVQKKYENRIERLKESMLKAVILFGDNGKTNKFIELPTVRLSTRKSTSIEEDNERINILIEHFSEFVKEIIQQGSLYTGDNVDIYGILNAINANVIAMYGEDFEPFSITDLTTMKLEVTTTSTIYDLFKSHPHALSELGENYYSVNIKNVTDKDSWKTSINLSENINTFKPTCAKSIVKDNLQIK